jgi:hypothetical protein
MIFIDKIVEVKKGKPFKSPTADEIVGDVIKEFPEFEPRRKELIEDCQRWLDENKRSLDVSFLYDKTGNYYIGSKKECDSFIKENLRIKS